MPAGARAAAAAGIVLLLAGCGSPAAPAAPPPTASAPAASVPAGPAPQVAVSGPTLPGRRPVVVLDPGHNGGNAAHPAAIGRAVDAGNGTRKDCNTVGTATDSGLPEHAVTWDVALRTRAALRAAGVDVRFTRPDDQGVGPCVDVRGRYGNAARADAVVSVHADGAAPGGSGFHVIEAARTPGGAGVAAAGRRLALAVRAALRAGSGLDYADYIAGGDGLDVRDDLAGLNLSTRPAVLVECGNLHNPADAALLSSPAGRERVATALALGILDFLRSVPTVPTA